MYKILFVVAVFAFALQGACGGPVAPESAADVAGPAGAAAAAAAAAPANPTPVKSGPGGAPAETDRPEDATTAVAPTDADADSGAAGSEVGVLLVQISCLALAAEHAMLRV